MRTSIEYAGDTIEQAVDRTVAEIGREVRSRSYRAANELQNQLNRVLRGTRHGRRYIVPGTGRMNYLKLKPGQRGLIYNKERKTARIVSGNTAWITHKYYTASAPGEPPANRTGAFRMSFHRRVYFDEDGGHNFTAHGVTESDLRVGGRYLLGELLEEGTERMAPRPYKQQTIDRAMPKILKIYREPYGRS